MRLLYFSPVAADSYAQRPHFMVRAWLEWGAESVLWVNPYPCRLPRWQDLRRGPGLSNQASPRDPRIRVMNVPALPIEPLPLGAWLNRRLLGGKAWRKIERYAADGQTIVGVGRPCALALAALGELQQSGSFYDAMDNFPEFYGGLSRRAMLRTEQTVAERVDLIVASSTFLADKFVRRGLRVEKVLNACETEGRGARGEGRGMAGLPAIEGLGFRVQGSEFLNSKSQIPNQQITNPESLVPRPSPLAPPVLGYVGCIGRWFDWPLVIRLARAMPDARLELVGPCVVKPPEKLPGNIRLLPACKHSAAAGHLGRFSAGLIPFVGNALTAGVDPIKYYEYRAAGLPVLSTSFGEMAMRGREEGVFFLDQNEDLAEVVRAALGRRVEPAETSRFHRENDWRCRFQGSGLLALLGASRRRHAA
ncbi:MAG: hypothetical protein K8R46_02650 [Pirellulales bacterium]|nr:hypothetical protein [Pirellulales bacterium]